MQNNKNPNPYLKKIKAAKRKKRKRNNIQLQKIHASKAFQTNTDCSKNKDPIESEDSTNKTSDLGPHSSVSAKTVSNKNLVGTSKGSTIPTIIRNLSNKFKPTKPLQVQQQMNINQPQVLFAPLEMPTEQANMTPWITDDLKYMLNRKQDAEAQYIQNPNNQTQHNLADLTTLCSEMWQLKQNAFMAACHQPQLSEGSTTCGVFTPQIATPVMPIAQVCVTTNATEASQQFLYSPTDALIQQTDHSKSNMDTNNVELSDRQNAYQKRPSAFDRLGPQKKKPTLTINLCLNKDQPVREVKTEETMYIPFHERENVIECTDEIVVKYLSMWPWNKYIPIRRTFQADKSATAVENDHLDQIYLKSHWFMIVTITGYPATWTKENVLDLLMDNLQQRTVLPCFIEFSKEKCKFLLIRNEMVLFDIHAMRYTIKRGDIELSLTFSSTFLTLEHLKFNPKMVLRERLAQSYDGVSKLDLKHFMLQEEVSHFLYFPLHRNSNQKYLFMLKEPVDWQSLVELNLSRNRITTMGGFNLVRCTPALKSLDLSHNLIEALPSLLSCRNLPLNTLNLEGNPLCYNYLDSAHYVEVVKELFPNIKELDGEKIKLPGQLPTFKQNYSPDAAVPMVEKFLETFFPLLDGPESDRKYLQAMYDMNALLTITHKTSLRKNPDYKYLHRLLVKSSNIKKKIYDRVRGCSNITKVIMKWPQMLHDPTTFTVDVISHSEETTILKVTGILKIVAETLADDEPLVSFTRTVCLHTPDGAEYKIINEMVHWDQPTEEYATSAFKLVEIESKPKKQIDLKFETIPDKRSQKSLVNAFMEVTELDEKASFRYLELKDWHFEKALQYFVKLLKENSTHLLYRPD